MKTVTATVLQNRFGQYLDECEQEAIGVSRNGRLKAVFMSIHEYNALKTIEQEYISGIVASIKESDFMGVAESEIYIDDILNKGEGLNEPANTAFSERQKITG